MGQASGLPGETLRDHNGKGPSGQNTPPGHSGTLPESLAGDTTHEAPGHFIGTSAVMCDLYTLIENAAASKATVFITGESGTGKDICAQTIHRLSPRVNKPFIALNCAAVPKDLIESALFGHVKGAFTGATENREGAIARAEGGTLFLDEICDMPIDMQTKLLRFVQDLRFTPVGGSREKTADIRIICATNKNPAVEIDQGRFRDDLYYRLHVVPITMPALRGRADDILDLADYFLYLYAAEERKLFRSFSPEAESFLVSHDWPGNVRELQNMIRYLSVLYNGARVELEMLTTQHHVRGRIDKKLPDAGPLSFIGMPLWQIEKQAIEQAIAACGGNIPRAAAMLEISPSTIYRKKQSWEDRC